MKLTRRTFLKIIPSALLLPKDALAALHGHQQTPPTKIHGWRFLEAEIASPSHTHLDTISFNKDLTFIDTTHSTYDRILLETLRGDHPEAKVTITGDPNHSMPDWLIYIDESIMSDHQAPSRLLAELFKEHQWTDKMLLQLGEEIQRNLERFTSKLSKAHHQVSRDGRMKVDHQENGNYSMGDRQALNLSLILAVRKIGFPHIDPPLVLHNFFGVFDSRMLHQISMQLKTFQNQIIITGPTHVAETMNAKVAYRFHYDSETGKERLVAA